MSLFCANEPYNFVRTLSCVDVNEHKLHLTALKIDHPEMTKFCLSWKRDSIFKLVYINEFLSDLSGWDVRQGPVRTGKISYRSTSVHSKKWCIEGLHSHGYGKLKRSVPKQVQKLSGTEKWIRNWNDTISYRSVLVWKEAVRYRTVLFSCEQKNRSSLGPLYGPVWFLQVTPSWLLWPHLMPRLRLGLIAHH